MAAAAKKEAPKAGGKMAAKPKKGGKLRMIILAIIIVPVALNTGLPTLLLCVGLLPTLVALIADTDTDKSGAATIGFMNLAGVFPFVMDLWQKGQTMEYAIALLKDPTTWVVMLGAAALGKLILFSVPPATSALAAMGLEQRLKTLRNAQKQLKEIWGPEVANSNGKESGAEMPDKPVAALPAASGKKG